MIYLRWQEDCDPTYKTRFSAGADLKSRIQLTLKAGEVRKVPTGVWIDRVEWSLVPENYMPELQIRARSGLAYSHRITLANAVGTVDADYPDEIQVLLWNFSNEDYTIEKNERVGQLVMNLVHRIPGIAMGGKRVGGFGSTGKQDDRTILSDITYQ